MPVINIKLTNPRPPRAQLDKIAAQITEIFVKELGKAPERVVINFDEISSESIYFGGKSVQAMREESQK